MIPWPKISAQNNKMQNRGGKKPKPSEAQLLTKKLNYFGSIIF